MKYLSNLESFDATFDFSNPQFLEAIFVSLGGSSNRDATVFINDFVCPSYTCQLSPIMCESHAYRSKM